MKVCTDLETWLLDFGDRIIRYLVYKKMFTPYEQKNAFVDESQYESNYYNYGIIEEVIDLGCGKWMLGIKQLSIDGEISEVIEYYKLEDIKLCYFEKDQELLLDKEESEDEI